MGEVDDDATTIRMLDAVDGLLRSRHDLDKQLAEGWMEMARARYAMGHARISGSLLSLRPHSALAAIREGEFPGLELEFRSLVEPGTKSLDDSDQEKEMYNRGLDPLSCFGGLVSPHLRASQRCFQTALGSLVQVATKQKIALQACSQIMKQQTAVNSETEAQ